ncbi:MAG: tyrosine-type recombinase/integrase [Myxococcota bacterium]
MRQRKDGRYEWRSPARLDGRRKALYEKNERAAQSAGRRWLLSNEGKAWMLASTIKSDEADRTLAEATEAFLASAKDRVRNATAAQYTSLLRTHVVPRRGHITLNRLTSKHLRTLYEDMRTGGATLSTCQATHIALRQVTKYALSEGWATKDPMTEVRRPGGSRRARVKDTSAIRYWTSDELKLVLHAAHRELNPRQALLFEVLAGTGCRISEALGLQFRDIRDCRMTFQRTWSKAREVEPMKSHFSRRTISITNKLSILVTQEKIRRSASPDDWIFCAGHGTPMDQDNIRKRLLKKVIKAAKVPTRTLHEIRHSHATMLLEAGTPIKVVQLRLGHADIATTISTYAHVTPALEGAAIDALENALS